MYQYRIFHQTWSTLRFTLGTLAVVAFLLLGGEVLRIFLDLYHVRPALGIAFNILLALALTVIWFRYRGYRHQHAQLSAAGLDTGTGSSQSELARALKHLIAYGRRLARQRLLSGEQVTTMLQSAHDLQAALDHHPLRDDLLRGIQQARDEMIGSAYGQLDAINARVIRGKALAILQDIYQPPFPVIPSVVATYHQFTMVSEVVDLYLPDASVGEYARAISDTWDVMTKGDFLRQGQRIYAGIEAGHHLGAASLELGQAVSLVWITKCVAGVATLRVKTLHDWKLNDAIAATRQQIIPYLQRTRDHLANDSHDIIKSIIRRYAPADGRDPRLYTNEIAAVLIKALDNVILTMSAEIRHAERRAAEQTDRTTTAPALDSADGDHDAVPHRYRLRRRRKKRRSLWRRLAGLLKPHSSFH